MANYRNLTTDEVQAKRIRGDAFRLIDVREVEEHGIAHIEGAELLPLSQAGQWINTLPRDIELVFFCHHGMRSQHIASFLASQRGYPNIANMTGGIEEWSLRIDPTIPRY
ncbi:MAG TPA: rhodanese-like domain-containing protein [Roseiflexaceae bacterium]|nr:rhodanese-like domain-containing protein [Roseiflexaceae bacterium]